MELRTNRPSEPASSQEELPLDEFCHNEVFDVLGNRRRRYILCYLLRQDGPTECRELAEQIAAWETASEREQVARSQYQSVYNSLYQTHLPELESVGLVEYDRSENLVSPTNQMEEVKRFINPVVPRFNEQLPRYLPTLMGGVLLVSVIAGTLVLFHSADTYLYAVEVVLVSIATLLVGARVR